MIWNEFKTSLYSKCGLCTNFLVLIMIPLRVFYEPTMGLLHVGLGGCTTVAITLGYKLMNLIQLLNHRAS